MKIIKQEELDLPDIVEKLRQGLVMVYPTETCYGLGCDATNEEAVKQVFEIKKRQQDKPVLVVASDVSMMMEYIVWNEQLDRIALMHWPGPLTIVVPLKPGARLPQGIVGHDNTIAFRVTDHMLASELCSQLGRPIVSTSANIESLESPYDMSSILDMFTDVSGQPDIVIDAGSLPHKSPSTIVKVVNGDIQVLRQGEIIVK